DTSDHLSHQVPIFVGRSIGTQPNDRPMQSLAEVAGKPSPAETSTESVATAAGVSAQHVQSNAGRSQTDRIEAQSEPHNSAALPQCSKVDIATRNNPNNSDNDQLIDKRSHGRALPK